ncbi:MAG: UDP-galactopyranose mutase [Paludibacter sp.]|nr:UDP-galactopyranose mutase [Paludibacter sp.]
MKLDKYDYLIVGSGLFGSVFAHQVISQGKTCLVIEKRPQVGGNVYCEKIEGINVQTYGAHIFHTFDIEVWNYVNQFVRFNRYTNSPLASYEDELYNLPFNMNTFHQLWNVKTPEEARQKIDKQRNKYSQIQPLNLEEQALQLVGEDIYEKLIKGYTEKQWGCSAKEIPSFIIKRIPLRFTYDNNYFNDPFQGIPIGGYNILVNRLLERAEILLNTDFLDNKNYFENKATAVVYSGMLDAYFDYCFGNLEYRSLRFETTVLDTDNFQGNAVVNYTKADVPYTRIIEHKHFEFGTQEKTVVTKEFPLEWNKNLEAYYPFNNKKNEQLADKYRELAQQQKNVIFGGRLANYKYYDMDRVVRLALDTAKQALEKK